MAKFTHPRALAAHQRKRAKAVTRAVGVQFEREAREMKAAAIRLTSGSVSQATLRRLGHPFARRRRREFKAKRQAVFGQAGIAPTLPINRQSSELVRSWRLTRTIGPSVTVFSLSNRAAHAAFILAPGGTATMIARPLWRRLRQLYRPESIERMRAAYRRAGG